jgi:hypothetical protein
MTAILIAAPASSPAKANDTQRFNYKVLDFDYTAKGYVSGTRGSTGPCVAGTSSTINGFSDSFPGELTAKPKLGDGDLTIGNRDTVGVIDAAEYVDFRQHGARELITECSEGAPSMVSDTNCDDTMTSKVEVNGLIKGSVGNLVRITWTISQEAVDGGWFPNFVCGGDTASFEMKKCRSPQLDLETITRPKFKLKFICGTPFVTAPPAGTGYDHYEALSNVSGVIKLKTTADRK